MKIKQLLATLIIISIAVAMLASCNGESNPTETQSSTESSSIESSTESASDTEQSTESETQKPTDTTPEETEPKDTESAESETQKPTDTTPVETEPTESETQAPTDTTDKEESTDKEDNKPTISSEIPSYLGIIASNDEPSSMSGLPNMFSEQAMLYGGMLYRSFGEALDEYFEDSSKHLNSDYPTESDYAVYSRAGETVYIQIWLNNPKQHTILSLKLNGTKYQVGGGLSSFFVDEGGQHYNCIYVAVTIPNDAYVEKAYTVSDIEYIADTFINADGTDEFMNNNDTVSIGLPYNAQTPAVSDFNTNSLTINSYSATFNLSDVSGLIELTNGWIGVSVYDGYNVVKNQSINIGNNTVNITGLVENTRYSVIVYLYADLHNGSGVSARVLYQESIETQSAITVDEMSGDLLYDSAKDGYYPAIKVDTTFNSNTAEYIKLEILDREEQVIYTDNSFSGSATVSENILCGSSYKVRVHYRDTEYPEGKYVEGDVWTRELGTPWYREDGTYTFVNDAVYYFQLNNNDENYPAINSFTLKLYKEESARWVASDVLYILNNPTAIDDLTSQIDELYEDFNAAYGNFELMDQIHDEISAVEEQRRPLEYAKWYLENRADNNTDKAYWQAEEAKGKYYYEFDYNGADTDTFFKVGKTYYAVLEDALTHGIGNFDVQIDCKYDKKNGEALTEDTMDQSVNVDRALTNHWVLMENLSYSNGNLTLTLYNEEDWGETERPPYAIGYVYKVVANSEVLYLDNTTHAVNIDEEAWFEAYIDKVKAGESVEGLMEEFVPDYESSYTIPLNTTNLESGDYMFEVYIRLIATDYEDDEYHACRMSEGFITVN